MNGASEEPTPPTNLDDRIERTSIEERWNKICSVVVVVIDVLFILLYLFFG
jgi:hypothetical protein